MTDKPDSSAAEQEPREDEPEVEGHVFEVEEPRKKGRKPAFSPEDVMGPGKKAKKG